MAEVNQVRIEDAVWAPHGGGAHASESLNLIRALKIGEVKRLYHPDLSCGVGRNKVCSIATLVFNVNRTEGKQIQYYHEKYQVAVIRRIK